MGKQGEFGFTNWGGRRKGAGRKSSGERKHVPHAPLACLCARTPVHVTLRIAAGLPSLRAKANRRLVLAALAAGSRPCFRVVHYAAMSNHVHMVCEADDERTLARGVQGLCVRLARGLNRAWQRVGPVFDDRYHARLLRTPREVRNALSYILQNARRHGLAVPAGTDPCSSACWFDGWKRTVARARAHAHPLPAARSWLLSVGWKRWGPLALESRPAGRTGARRGQEVSAGRGSRSRDEDPGSVPRFTPPRRRGAGSGSRCRREVLASRRK